MFRNRALDALAKTVLCFALLHQVLLIVHVVTRRDPGALNVFTMLEADRLAPGLAAGAGVQLASAALALMVYLLVYAMLTRRDGVADASAPAAAAETWTRFRRPRSSATILRPTPLAGATVLVAGILVHTGLLALIGRFVSAFPSVPDVLHPLLPYADFGIWGELCFVAFLGTTTAVLFRSQPRTISAVLTMLGLFYVCRGLFLFFLPIGAPPTAPPPDARYVLYPFPSHAYFPGGHAGLMTILSLSVLDRRWRYGLLAGALLFGLGTLIARTHYSADLIGGWLLGYGIVIWGRRHLDARAVIVPLSAAARETGAARTARVANRVSRVGSASA